MGCAHPRAGTVGAYPAHTRGGSSVEAPPAIPGLDRLLFAHWANPRQRVEGEVEDWLQEICIVLFHPD